MTRESQTTAGKLLYHGTLGICNTFSFSGRDKGLSLKREHPGTVKRTGHKDARMFACTTSTQHYTGGPSQYSWARKKH